SPGRRTRRPHSPPTASANRTRGRGLTRQPRGQEAVAGDDLTSEPGRARSAPVTPPCFAPTLPTQATVASLLEVATTTEPPTRTAGRYWLEPTLPAGLVAVQVRPATRRDTQRGTPRIGSSIQNLRLDVFLRARILPEQRGRSSHRR